MTIDVGQGLLNAVIFLAPVAIIAIFISMWLWERTCRKKIKVIIVKNAGGVDITYVPKEGSEVTIPNPKSGIITTWLISKLATIPMPYPDLAGLLPRFLQREIQTAILLEDDWEPLLNRSAHIENVASPNVVKLLQEIKEATDNEVITERIERILDNIATSPTREMIADPAALGALRQNTIMRALSTVSDDIVEAIKGLRMQLSRVAGLNPMLIYLGLFVAIALGIANIVMMQQGASGELIDKVDAIYKSLGITQ